MVEKSLDAESIADWLEWEMLTHEKTSVSFDVATHRAQAELDIDAARVAAAITTIHRRANLLGDRYPFRVRSVGWIRRPLALKFPYSALLAMTPARPQRTFSPQQIKSAGIVLEYATTIALSEYLGEGAVALRFGWPSDDGRPQEFSQAIAWLSQRMGIASGAAYRPPRRRDGGVDVVAWRPFPDGRGGFPVILAQVTVGAEVLNKAADIDLRLWSGWLALDADPMVALVVPGTIPSGEIWNEIAARSVIFERIRLSGILPVPSHKDETGPLADFVADQVEVG